MSDYLNYDTGKPISIDDDEVVRVDKTSEPHRTILVLKSGSEIPVRGSFKAITESVHTGKSDWKDKLS